MALDDVQTENAMIEVYRAKADGAASDRIQATQSKAVLAQQIRSLKANRDQLLDVFRESSFKLFPELQFTVDDSLFLSSIPQDHKALVLFKYKFKPQLNQIDKELAQKVKLFVDYCKAERSAFTRLNQVTNDYDLFVSESDNDLPALEQVSPGVTAPIDTGELEANVFADVLGLEFIDPRVQQYIFSIWTSHSDQESLFELGSYSAEVDYASALTTGPEMSLVKVSQDGSAVSTLSPNVSLDTPPKKPINKYVVGGAALIALIYILRG